ncbi:MAG: NAD-dependent epimerase/dehydratase family protein [Gemmatimonadetes bacterium]|nr:NAD-dependent epimerase/dehydratase family protein [Gemmatimonadota bacterium]
MDVLILGGTRFFGYFTARALAEAGHRVTVFTRGRVKAELPAGVRHVLGDRENEADLRRVTEGGRGGRWDAVWDNISYTAAHAEAAVRVFRGRCGVFLHTSTLAVYSVCEGLLNPYREEDFDAGRPMEERRGIYPYAYGLDRRAGEIVLRRAHESFGFPAVVIRLPVVMGPRDYSLRAWAYWRRLREGGPILLPDGARDVHRFVYSGDVVRTVVRILESGATHAGQAFNLAQREIVSLREFVERSARVLDVQPELLDVPSDALQAAGLVLDDLSPFSPWGNHLLDVRKAVTRLGFEPTPFAEWLPGAIEWHVANRAAADAPGWRSRPAELEFARRWRELLRRI